MSILSTDVQTLGHGLLYNPTVVPVLEQQIMGIHANETPTAPVLLFHAAQDEIIPYANASTLYNEWCSHGASVQFTTFANGGHLTTEILGLPLAVNFAQAAFAGTVASGCSTSTVLNNTLDPLALGVKLEPALAKLVNALNTLGNEDENLRANLATITQPIV